MCAATSAPTNMACRCCSQTDRQGLVLECCKVCFTFNHKSKSLGSSTLSAGINSLLPNSHRVTILCSLWQALLLPRHTFATSLRQPFLLSRPTFAPSLSLHHATACGVPDGAKRVVSFGLSPWLACLLGLGLVGSERHQGGRSTEASREG